MGEERPNRDRGAYIAEIRISDRVLAKLADKHQVAGFEVREAFVLTPLERAGWEFDDERGGWRLLATGTTYADRKLDAVLYPIDEEEGIWWLGTALGNE